MDDIFKPIEKKLEALTSTILANKFNSLDVENSLPAILTKEQLKKMLGCGSSEIERYVNSESFPVIRANGKQDRFPRDAVRDYLKNNWQKIS